MWVTKFEIQYSQDGQQWDKLKGVNGTTVFEGNKDRNSIVEVRFPEIDTYPF